jgi:hypothetical protein
MKDNQLAKLIKQNLAKVEKAQSKKSKVYDPTLKATQRPTADKDDEGDIERSTFFKEMKRREF